MIEIPEKIYQALMNDTLFLEILENNGVDNWQGYEDSVAEFRALKLEIKNREENNG